jgi:cytochrome bd-type quinol oxidase subunit 1
MVKNAPRYFTHERLQAQPGGNILRPRDHNKALAILNTVLGSYCVIPLLASPWILAKSIDAYPSPRRADQISIAVVVCTLLIVFGALFLSTAYGLWRRRRWARRVTLIAALVQLFFFPFLAVYSYWFLHSEEGRRLYDVPPVQE